MKGDKELEKEFVVAVTIEVSKMIAADDHISVEEAGRKFKQSRVYNYLCNSTEPFYEEDPTYFFELYKNLENKGIMLDNTDLYLRNHPELYSTRVD